VRGAADRDRVRRQVHVKLRHFRHARQIDDEPHRSAAPAAAGILQVRERVGGLCHLLSETSSQCCPRKLSVYFMMTGVRISELATRGLDIESIGRFDDAKRRFMWVG
jgi:hypothetical protein